jgi:hypothetical protein
MNKILTNKNMTGPNAIHIPSLQEIVLTSKLSAVACFLSTGLLCAILTGCALTETATTHSPIPGPAISGVAFGGQQPITGAKVYLLAANPAGYGSASLSLLTSASTGSTVDSVGAYATTAAVTGGFNLAPAGNADYDCTQGYALGVNTTTATPTNLLGNEQVYLYIKGGNSGSGTNNSIGLLAALGPCNNIYSNTITVNELTTVAAAYAFAGYATDATHLASSGSALALTGLSNAGLNSRNLVNLATGLPVDGSGPIIPAAGSASITRPGATIYTLGNMLAACVNGRSGNTNCSTLFTYTQSAGTTGGAPAETATAAINLAHNPWPGYSGMTALYGLVPATGAPFSGGVASQPNDFTVALKYTGGGLNLPFGIDIDVSGNAWIANAGGGSVSEFSSTGNAISPSTGFTGGGLSGPQTVAIDAIGNVWAANGSAKSVSKLSSAGIPLSTAGYTASGINQPFGIAIDSSGNAWTANFGSNSFTKLSSTGAFLYTNAGINEAQGIAIDGSGNTWVAATGTNSISEIANNGTSISPVGGYTVGGLRSPIGVAIDNAGNVWAANFGNSVSKLSSTGTAISSSAGYTGGGINDPYFIAIDSAGTAWTANNGNSSVSRLSSFGAALSPSTGYTDVSIYQPTGIAIDGSGDVWISNHNNSLTELIGAASPVVTPLSANLVAPYSAPASKP